MTLREMASVARAQGEKQFHSGSRCVQGHDGPRWTSNLICVSCQQSHARRYYVANRAKVAKQVREYERTHKEKTRRWSRSKYLKRRPKMLAAIAERYRADPEYRARRNRQTTAWKGEHPEAVCIIRRRYRARHASQLRGEESRRRALKAGATVGPPKLLGEFERWARSAPSVPCYWCGRRTRPKKRHLDHIIPIALGGVHSIGNLCVACPGCNQRKHAKMPEEFSGQAELSLA
jgi:5-methylcytosine-specific restriction endonuclease McrA